MTTGVCETVVQKLMWGNLPPKEHAKLVNLANAAPDLLAACKLALARLKELGQDQCYAGKDLRAAIAKADAKAGA